MSAVLKYAVGIDISSDKFDAGFGQLHYDLEQSISRTRKFDNREGQFKEFVKWIEKKRVDSNIPLLILMEATGVYHERLAYFLYEKGYEVCILLPSLAKFHLKSQGHRSKTDPQDAKGLTQMGLEKKLRIWQPPCPILRQVRDLVRHRQRLQELITRTNNQLHALKHTALPSLQVKKSLKKMIKGFKIEIEWTEAQIRQIIAQDPVLEAKIERIVVSIKGVGWITLVTLIGETNQFLLFSSRQQLIKYAGYDVIENQSGKAMGRARISKRGNHRIRRILHMPALNVVNFGTGDFPQIYQRIYERKGIKMKAYVAIQRKLLCLIYTLWKNDQVFDPNFVHPLSKKTVAA